MFRIIIPSSGFLDYLYAGWSIADDYLREIFPMQPSGVLMPPTYAIGVKTDYRLSPNNVMGEFEVILGRAMDEENRIFLLPTTIGLLRMEVGVGSNWIFIEFGDITTWYQKNGDGNWLPFCTEFSDEEY